VSPGGVLLAIIDTAAGLWIGVMCWRELRR
jgi:hypothetical protein